MLFARLQLGAPEARTFLVAPPCSPIDAYPTAMELATLAAEAGCAVRLIRFVNSPGAGRSASTGTDSAQGEAGKIETVDLAEAEMGGLDRLRCTLTPFHGITVVAGGGLLESPAALLAACLVDAVIVVVQRGKTARTDLDRVRREVDRAGGKIAGAVLVK